MIVLSREWRSTTWWKIICALWSFMIKSSYLVLPSKPSYWSQHYLLHWVRDKIHKKRETFVPTSVQNIAQVRMVIRNFSAVVVLAVKTWVVKTVSVVTLRAQLLLAQIPRLTLALSCVNFDNVTLFSLILAHLKTNKGWSYVLSLRYILI